MSAFVLSTPLLRSRENAARRLNPSPLSRPRVPVSPRRLNTRAPQSQLGLSSEGDGKSVKGRNVLEGTDKVAAHQVSIDSVVSSSPYAVDTKSIKTDNAELLRAFIKTRASLDPTQEIVYHFTGTVYASPANRPAVPLFLLDAFSVGRAVPIDGGGYRLLTREVALYLDLETKQPISVFKNPMTKAINNVVPVLNDPVNQQLLPDKCFLSTTDLASENICFNCDVFPRYPTPLPLTDFPDVGSDEPMYNSTELFHFIVPYRDLQSPSTPTTTSCAITWSRIGPWLPWMCMQDIPGNLTYHCRGAKLSGGFSELPEHIRQFVQSECPQFAHAPTVFTTPNETSWSYMRKLIEQKGFPRADGRIANRSTVAKGKTPSEQSSAVSTESKTERPLRGLTRRELRAFRSVYPNNKEVPIYLCIAGKIFDVSESPEHYGFGETYHCLTGCDATRAFLSGDLSNVANQAFDASSVDTNALSEAEKKTLDGWISWLGKKYEQVAVLLD